MKKNTKPFCFLSKVYTVQIYFYFIRDIIIPLGVEKLAIFWQFQHKQEPLESETSVQCIRDRIN